MGTRRRSGFWASCPSLIQSRADSRSTLKDGGVVGIVQMDVTDQIVRLFKMDPRALKHIDEIQGQPPLPLEDLSGRID